MLSLTRYLFFFNCEPPFFTQRNAVVDFCVTCPLESKVADWLM